MEDFYCKEARIKHGPCQIKINMIHDLTVFSQTKRHKVDSVVAAPAVYGRSVGKGPFTLSVNRVFPFLVLKLGEFV